MQGFQPAARRLAQLPKPQRLADGGAVGFGARGLSGLRSLIPQVQAMGYQQAAPAPVPAPTDSRASQLLAMIPQMEAMGFKQQRLAEGGLVRGPGTGTSDSIEDEAEPGTFIMPADSTEAIGPSALEKMGTVPVRLSDGEFKMPPEQVMAIGEAVLKLMKDATHTPVNGVDGGQTDDEVAQDHGFSPAATQRMQELPQFADGGMVGFPMPGLLPEHDAAWMPAAYADGGMVDPARRPNSFGDAAAVSSDSSVTQARTSAADAFGRAPVSAPAAPVTSANPAATRMGSFTDPRSTAYDPNPFAGANAAKLSTAGQPSRSIVEAGTPPVPAPATARNSFGDAAAATRDGSVTQVASGYQPGGGTVNTVPAMPLSARVETPSTAPVSTAAVQAAAGFPSAAQRMAAAPAAPMGWAERNAQRNLEVSASSILNSPARTSARQQLAMLPQASGYQPRRFADGGTVQDDLQARLAQTPVGGPPGWNGGGLSAAATQEAPARVTPAASPVPSGALSRAASHVPNAQSPSMEARSTGAALQPQPQNDLPVSAQNLDAAQGLASRGAAGALAQMPATPQGVQTPVIRHSGNDWQARKDLENARTSAMSITNNGGRWDRHKGGSPAQAEYMALLNTDQALRSSAPGLALQGMKEQGDTQRAGMQVAASSANAAADRMAAMDRTLVTERGNNTRAGISAAGALEAARLKAHQDGKAPPGYRWTASGDMEAIPGGPADLKQNKEGVQQGKDTQDIFSILNEARPLMNSATGSYAGVGMDKLAQTFGVATDGAKATAQLKALEGALVSKMPKMSGPQSDKDVLLYKQMAGQIGDPTIPVEQRRAAMNTIESLNMKYLPGVTDAAGYQAVPSGAYYKTPAGEVRRKP